MIIGEIIGAEKVMSFLEKLPGESNASLQRAVLRLALMLSNYVKENELTGQALKTKTGRLKGSITPKVTNDGAHYTGIVGTNVEYARIHEFGGTTKPHDIYPVRAKALLFARAGFIGPMEDMKTQGGRYAKGKMGRVQRGLAEGSMQFARGVHHPGSKMPMRSFLRTALRACDSDIRAGLEQAIRDAVQR